MKYGEIIKDLAARGHNWSYYDQNFRFLRQRQASAFPWGVMHRGIVASLSVSTDQEAPT